jgi:hypothetical protein
LICEKGLTGIRNGLRAKICSNESNGALIEKEEAPTDQNDHNPFSDFHLKILYVQYYFSPTSEYIAGYNFSNIQNKR